MENGSPKYELIIFDCDGTLVDTEPLTNRLISTMMAEQGISMTPIECLDEFAGKNIMHITGHMEKFIGPFDHVAFEEEYRERCLHIFDDELDVIPGVMDILPHLKVKKCIASNGPKRKMAVTLKVTGIMDYFDDEHIFSAYDIKKWKPSPELYLHAAQVMGVPKEKSLVVEDTVPGLMGAINGGIDAIAYNPEEDPALHLDGVTNFKEMKEIRKFFSRVGVMSNFEL